MNNATGYLPPIAIDEVVRSGGVAEVLSIDSSATRLAISCSA